MPIKDEHLNEYDGHESIDLLTLEDAYFTIPILFGDPLKGNMQAEFIPYSMSSILSVAATDCSSCGTAQYYDRTKST